ncbi:MAG: hypothetical protein R3A44_16170 [Caldilineaceae bacterium]
MDIHPIRNEADYETALHEIEQLMEIAQPGSPEEDKLDLLATLVDVYEDAHHPILPPDPIDALEHYLDRKGLTRKALEPYIGHRGRVAEIMNRRRPLTLDMIRKLEKGTGIPASILVQPYDLQPYEQGQYEAVPA